MNTPRRAEVERVEGDERLEVSETTLRGRLNIIFETPRMKAVSASPS